MKSRKNIIFLLIVVLLASVLVFTFFLCAGNTSDSKYIMYSRENQFNQVLLSEKEDYELTYLYSDSDYNPVWRLKNGSLYVCYDVQAVPFINKHRDFKFTHVTYCTTGIAVKKETADNISGYNDILDSDLTLYYPANPVTRKTAMASLS